MNWGDLSSQFKGIAWKRLSAHEVDPSVSNGHEFQGVAKLRELLGSEVRAFPTTYMLLNDESDDIESVRSEAKWYDARANQPQRAEEWRLYYPEVAGRIQFRLEAGDLMVIARTQDDDLLIMLAPAGSNREAELAALFGQLPGTDRITTKQIEKGTVLDFAMVSILNELGITIEEVPSDGTSGIALRLAEELFEQFPESLPAGQVISALVQSRISTVDVIEAPDEALMEWIETEEIVFRGWEDQKIAARIAQGFVSIVGKPDVAAYRQFSMSLRQSRVSRAGGALELHAKTVFERHHLRFGWGESVDGGEKPDFIFPGVKEYRNPLFPAAKLRMLGVKFTVKDRWRQVLNEAERIPRKHLFTLDAGISTNQLALMSRASLQPVIPIPVQARYSTESRQSLMSLSAFVEEVKSAQTTQ